MRRTLACEAEPLQWMSVWAGNTMTQLPKARTRSVCSLKGSTWWGFDDCLGCSWVVVGMLDGGVDLLGHLGCRN